MGLADGLSALYRQAKAARTVVRDGAGLLTRHLGIDLLRTVRCAGRWPSGETPALREGLPLASMSILDMITIEFLPPGCVQIAVGAAVAEYTDDCFPK